VELPSAKLEDDSQAGYPDSLEITAANLPSNVSQAFPRLPSLNAPSYFGDVAD